MLVSRLNTALVFTAGEFLLLLFGIAVLLFWDPMPTDLRTLLIVEIFAAAAGSVWVARDLVGMWRDRASPRERAESAV